MFKLQCQCGHRIAVPQSYQGKRIKCPRCQGALAVPVLEQGVGPTDLEDPVGFEEPPQPRRRAAASIAPARPAARSRPATQARPAVRAPAQAAPYDQEEIIRAKHYVLAQKQRGQNIAVAIMFVVLLIIGGAVATALVLNRQHNASLGVLPSTPRKSPRTDTANSTRPAEPSPRDVSPRIPSAVTQATLDRYTNRKIDPVATTSTYDAAANTTTVESKPTPIVLGERGLLMLLTLTHDGKDLAAAANIKCLVRLKGDFNELMSVVGADEPRLVMTIDERRNELMPSAAAETPDRSSEGLPRPKPVWVEYTFERATLMALARATEVACTIGPSGFRFTSEQLAMFQGFFPPPVKQKPAAEKEMEKDAAKEPEKTE